jgi:hypothetical protein
MTSWASSDLTPPRGGKSPPAEARVGDGEVVWLRPVAETVARRLHAEFPDEADRYGPAGFEWCVHDNQYLVYWASLSDDVFTGQLDWLAAVLEARAYPLRRLARDLEIAGEVVSEAWGKPAEAVARRLRAGAAQIAG